MQPLAFFPTPPILSAAPRPAVFLDRDGVLNENRADYVLTWEQVTFLPGVFEALRRLAASSYAVVVVTNQSAVGRGLLRVDTLDAIHRGLVEAIHAAGGRVDAVYACPHAPAAACTCRKPRPGLLLQAAADLNLDLRHSWLIGDAVSDLEAAAAVGSRPLLVLSGRGARQRQGLAGAGLAHVPALADLPAAVARVVGHGEI